jgi:luciferase family oxidoreductase group 1
VTPAVPLSILDLALVGPGQTAGDALAACVSVARAAESLGYRRVWYAEHHNFSSIASSATSVVIAHVAAHTRSIRLGSGGVMLPNHAPLVVAEQFGTLASLHPGRIDLGLGRAPGTDAATLRALRVDPTDADRFEDDVRELQAYLSDRTLVPGVNANPGRGTHVPLYILGSSLFGAMLAARLGLPYAFASHFAPASLEQAVDVYRAEFRPSAQCAAPYVIAGVNVVAADDPDDAAAQVEVVQRLRVKALFGRGRDLSDAEAQALLDSHPGVLVREMTKHTAVGTGPTVRAYVDAFARFARADELITVHPSPSVASRLRSIELLAGATAPDDGGANR